MSTLTQFFGGGGVPIGSLVDVPDYAPNVYEVGGQTYLRSGVTALGSTYPQVPSTLLGDVFENESYANTGITDYAIQEFIGTNSDTSLAPTMEVVQDGSSKLLTVFSQKTPSIQSAYDIRYYLLSTDQGVTWKRYLLPNIQDTYNTYPMSYVTASAYFDGKFYIFYSNGTLRTSIDGLSWVLIANAGIDFVPVKQKVVNNRLFVFAFRWETVSGTTQSTATTGSTGIVNSNSFFYTSDGSTWVKNTSITNQPHDVTFDGTNYYFINTSTRGVYKGAAVQGNPPTSGYTTVGTSSMSTIYGGWTIQGGHWPASIEWDQTNSKIWCLYSDYIYNSYTTNRGVTMYVSADGGTNWSRIDINPSSSFGTGFKTSFQINIIGNDVYLPIGYTYVFKIIGSTNALSTIQLASTWFEGTAGLGSLLHSAGAHHIKHGSNYIVTSFSPNTSGPQYRIWKFSEQTPYSMTASDELYHRGYAQGYTKLLRKSSSEFLITIAPVNSITNSTVPPIAYSNTTSYVTADSAYYYNGGWVSSIRAYLWDHYLHSTDNGVTFTERKLPYKAQWFIGKGQGNVFYAFARCSVSQQTTFWQTNTAGTSTADNRVYTSTDLINWTRVGDFATSTYQPYDMVGTPTATIIYTWYPPGGAVIHKQIDAGQNWQSVTTLPGFATYPNQSTNLPKPVYDEGNNVLGVYSIGFAGTNGQMNFLSSVNDWASFTSTVISYTNLTDAIKIGNRHIATRDGSLAIQDDNWATSTITLAPTLTEFANNFFLSGVMHYDENEDVLYVRIGNRLYIQNDKGTSFFRNDTAQTDYQRTSTTMTSLSTYRNQVRNHVNDIEQIAGGKLIYLCYNGIRSPLTGDYIQNQKFVSGATNSAKYMRVA